MGEKSKSAGNFWILTVIITVVVFMLGWYFLIYVPQHEERITERNFRELNQVSQNLSRRANSLITNARNVVTDSSETAIRDLIMSILFCNEEKVSTSDLLRVETILSNEIEKFNNKISFSEVSLDTSLAANDQDKIELLIKTPKPTVILYSDRIPITQLTDNGIISCNENDNSPLINIDSEGFTHLAYKIEIEAPALIGDLLHFDVFENFLLTTNNWPIYESNPSGSLVFEEFSDSLEKNSQNNVPQVKSLSVNGVDYDVYIRPIHISQNQVWNLVGFVRSDIIWSESLSISPKVSLFLVVISILVILSMPLIKLRLINDREKVNTLDVISTYISIVGLASIAAILIFSFYKFKINEINLRQNLISIGDDITRSFNTELQQISTFLNELDNSLNKLDDSPSHLPFNNIDEHIFFEDYPYIEDYFVINSLGYQEKKWTVRKNRTPKFNVASRPYVNRLRTETGYSLDNDWQMFIQSIVSYNTGQELAVITRESSNRGKIIGLTTKLYSLYDTVLPYGYQFCVFDANGLVHFHSDSDKNLNENFFNEVSNSEAVRKKIQANDLGYTSFFYRGKKSAVNFSQLSEGLPFYLAVIGDKGIQYGIFSRVLRVTITISALLLMLFFVGLYIRARLKNSPPSYSSLLRPVSKDRELSYSSLWYLTFLFCILIPVLIFSFSYKREAFTLNRLTEKKTAEFLENKERKTKDYIAWLGHDLSNENYEMLKSKHTERNKKGNYSFAIDTSGSFSVPGHFTTIAITYFDHEMNNTFRAYQDSTLMIGLEDQMQLIHSSFGTSGSQGWLKQEVIWLIFILLILPFIYVVAVKVFKLVKERLFEVCIQPSDNWLCSDYKELENKINKLFLVNVSKDKFINDPKDWKQMVHLKSSVDDLDEDPLRMVRFPSNVDDITEKDVDFLLKLSKSSKRVTIVCRQSPAILVQELKGDLGSKFQEAFAEFETYYWKLNFSEKDARESKKKPLKTSIEFKKLFGHLSKEEQYLLYDLAEDGIVNTKNSKVLEILYKKGIIVASKDSESEKEESVLTGFYFFDADEKHVHGPKHKRNKNEDRRSLFREFILDIFDNELIKKVKEEVEGGSTWSKYRTPILLIFGGLFLFILLTQQQIAQEIIGILTTLGILIGSISKITNTIASRRNSSPTDAAGVSNVSG